MPSEPRWLTADEVAQLNRRAVAATAEPYLILNLALLEGACGRPINRWHFGVTDVPSLAGWLLLAVAQAHAFQQGNKRTGLLAANGFLSLNGWRLDAADDLAEMILAALDHSLAETDFVASFAAQCTNLAQRVVRRARFGRPGKKGYRMIERYLPKK